MGCGPTGFPNLCACGHLNREHGPRAVGVIDAALAALEGSRDAPWTVDQVFRLQELYRAVVGEWELTRVAAPPATQVRPQGACCCAGNTLDVVCPVHTPLEWEMAQEMAQED